MFSKKDEINTMDTLIGESSTFEGNIKSKASLRIEGKIIGDIECEGDVTIGEKGEAVSNIHARNIVIAGSLKGNVHANNAVTITSTGKVFGNLHTQALIIHEGAKFQGNTEMQLTNSSKEYKGSQTSKDSPIYAQST